MDLSLNRLSMYNNTPWTNGQEPSNDPARWMFQGGCGTAGTAGTGLGNGQAFARCLPDNQLWTNLMNELGGALAPGLSAPAMTLGYNGLYIGFEEAVTNLNRNSEYWRRGTQGSPDALTGSGTAATRNQGDADAFVSRIHVRKGFPMGFELGTTVSHLDSSSIWAMGLDLRWAPFEGYRHGMGILPDFAVRGAVNTVVGQSQFNLTVVSVDATISKRFTLGGQVRVSPYLGVQELFILADSGVIDMTPARNAYAECPRQPIDYVPDTTPVGSPGRSPSGLIGQRQCTGGTAIQGLPGGLNDTVNTSTFEPVRIARTRAFLGMQLQWDLVMFTGEFAFDAADPTFFRTPSDGTGRPSTTTAGAVTPMPLAPFWQWPVTIGAGVAFR